MNKHQVDLKGTIYNLEYNTKGIAKLEDLCGRTVGEILTMDSEDGAKLISAKFIAQLIFVGLNDKLTLNQVYDIMPLNELTSLSETAFTAFTEQIIPDVGEPPTSDENPPGEGEQKPSQ